MYKLSVGSLFKNESHCLKEWLEHYLMHGVEHFYLINDKSTDDYLSILTPYIEKNIVTLFEADFEKYLGRQRNMYNHFILPRFQNKETKWLIMVDLDEFVWSPFDINLALLLDRCNHLGQIQVNYFLFGSNGHIKQPISLVDGFNKRSSVVKDCTKYFVNSDFDFSSLNVHYATFVNKEHEKNNFIKIDNEYFVINHYSCQSKDFWINIKCTRGDADNYRNRTVIGGFNELDINEVEDNRLREQNKSIIDKLYENQEYH